MARRATASGPGRTGRRDRRGTLVDLLDAYAERLDEMLCCEAELDVDGEQSVYDTLPRELQRAFVHLAFLKRDANRWPPAALVTSVAEYRGADVGQALCLMGWTPDPRR